MREDERTPLVAGGEARASKQAGSLNLGKTAWSFCMGLILVALAVLGAVLAVGSARGGIAQRDEARFVRDGLNESGAALASVDDDYAHDAGRLEASALGEAQPPLLDPVPEEADASPEAMKARRVARRTAFRVANRERAEREERERAEKEAAAAAAAAAAVGMSEEEAAEAERLRLAARARRVRARRIARGEIPVAEEGAEENPRSNENDSSSSPETTAERGATSEGTPDDEGALSPEERAAAEQRRAAARARRQRIRDREAREDAEVLAAAEKADREGVELAQALVPEVAQVAEGTAQAAPEAAAQATPTPPAPTPTPTPTPTPAPAPTAARATRGEILAAASAAVAHARGDEKAEAAKAEASSTPTSTPSPTPLLVTLAPPPGSPASPPPAPLSAQDLLDAIAADAQPRPPPAPYPPLPPSPPPSPPPPPPPTPRPPHPPAHPPIGQPPAAFRSLVPLPGIVAEVGPVTAPSNSKEGTREEEEEKDVHAMDALGHLGVVSAFWEDPLRDDGRWHSARKDKTPDYYRRGLDNLVRAAARAGNSVVVYTAETSNECQALEVTYAEGKAAYQEADPSGERLNSSDGASDGASDGSAARFLCVKLPLQNLHYGDWHLADHSLVKNMPCSEKMRDTKLIWLNKINLVESAAHMLALPGGKKATRMEWVDADLYAERDDLAANLGGARGRGLTLEDLFQWKPIPSEADALDRGERETEGIARASAAEATLAAAAAAAADASASAAADGKPPPGFKIIPGITYSWSAKRQLPEDQLMTWQVDAQNRVAAMERAREGRRLGSIPGDGDDAGDGFARLGSATRADSLPAADRVQMGCYAPGQRVGPCTSNHFVASRFRASVYGIAAMRQAFEDVLYDYEHEFPGPGFEGWSVQNLTWFRDADVAHDRPGYPTHAFMYAKDGFTRSKDDWCCVCSTEEMIYNKMFRRNPGLFNPDAHCDKSEPYETMEKGVSPAAAASAPRRAGRR
jgi:hypothetical protein